MSTQPTVFGQPSPELTKAIGNRNCKPIGNGQYDLPTDVTTAATKFTIDFVLLKEVGQLAVYLPKNSTQLKILFLIIAFQGQYIFLELDGTKARYIVMTNNAIKSVKRTDRNRRSWKQEW